MMSEGNTEIASAASAPSSALFRARDSPTGTRKSSSASEAPPPKQPRMASVPRVLPPGIQLIKICSGNKHISYGFAKGLVLVLTFLTYAAYHASRKPPSIVKSVLTDGMPNVPGDNGWVPFNGKTGKGLLGSIDLAFLLSYSFGMFYCGHLGDRLDLRHFLSFGMVTSGIAVAAFGYGQFHGIHDIKYYFVVSVIAGLCQATGWPSVVSIMANWFGKGKRGLVMGAWNAHTSIGNIAGSVIAAQVLSWGWGYAFVLPGLLISLLGFVVFTCLIVQPSDLSLGRQIESPSAALLGDNEDDMERTEPAAKAPRATHGVSFWSACMIPGVIPFAFCLFFSKLVAYVFLYWLPFYLRSTEIQGRILSPKEAGDTSIAFDVGGIFGGVMAGFLSDYTGASATVASSFMTLSLPCLYAFRTYASISFGWNIALMVITGFFVNGPYALITTAVSADLGNHESLQGNEKALATVTAIIDGMGSLGGAVGPAAVGYITQMSGGFDNVFNMLYASAVTAAVLLFRLVMNELGNIAAVTKA